MAGRLTAVRLMELLFCLSLLACQAEKQLDGSSREAARAQEKPKATANVWTIGIYTGPSVFELAPAEGIENPVLTSADVTEMEVDIVAHPFVIVADSLYYVFFTAKHSKLKQGGIGSASSRDGLHWTYSRIVLDEPYDLTYPYVIRHNDEYYMIPEAHTETTLRLYRATDFPDQWEYMCDLLSGDHIISPSLLHFNNVWWLFASRLGNETLRLFYSDDLLGPWVEHQQSPIVEKDLNTARPAGRPLVIDGVPYRLGQDCDPVYGNKVHAFRINVLSKTEYAEEIVEKPIIRASGKGWNADAMHHVDALRKRDGTWLAVVDAWGRILR